MARPMPRDPPVTRATFPLSDCIAITISQRCSDVAIIGAGELGGAVAHVLARRDVVRSITLIDDSGRVAAGKALDIAQAAPVEGFATQLSGSTDVSMAAGAAIVILADRADRGAAANGRATRAVLLLKRLTQTAAGAVILCAGASQRELVDRGVRELHFRRERLVRLGARSTGGRRAGAGGAGGRRLAARRRAVGARRAARADRDSLGRRDDRRLRADAPASTSPTRRRLAARVTALVAAGPVRAGVGGDAWSSRRWPDARGESRAASSRPTRRPARERAPAAQPVRLGSAGIVEVAGAVAERRRAESRSTTR